MYQRVSFSCVLSTLSPVAITSSGRVAHGAAQAPHLAHRLLHHERDQPFLRAVRRVERAAVAVDELHTRGRLLVDELEVGQLHEGDQHATPSLAPGDRLAELGPDDARFARSRLEPTVAVPVDDRAADRRRRGRRGTGRDRGRRAQRSDDDQCA